MENTVALYSRLGLRLMLDSAEMMDREVIETGTWESEQLAYFSRLIECFRGNNATFLDVGAHWGLFSLLALKSHAFSRINAFESDTNKFAQLHANLLLNGGVEAIEARGTLDPIDSVLAISGAHLLMRIDATGHENAVLHGMMRTVKNNKVVIQIQVFKPHHEKVFREVERLRLRTIHTSYPHYCLTNMMADELRI